MFVAHMTICSEKAICRIWMDWKSQWKWNKEEVLESVATTVRHGSGAVPVRDVPTRCRTRLAPRTTARDALLAFVVIRWAMGCGLLCWPIGQCSEVFRASWPATCHPPRSGARRLAHGVRRRFRVGHNFLVSATQWVLHPPPAYCSGATRAFTATCKPSFTLHPKMFSSSFTLARAMIFKGAAPRAVSMRAWRLDGTWMSCWMCNTPSGSTSHTRFSCRVKNGTSWCRCWNNCSRTTSSTRSASLMSVATDAEYCLRKDSM